LQIKFKKNKKKKE